MLPDTKLSLIAYLNPRSYRSSQQQGPILTSVNSKGKITQSNHASLPGNRHSYVSRVLDQ
jgi:hypothetical protein